MADVFSKSKRSHVMSRIRGRGNKTTELAMVAFLRRNRFTGWRRHQRLFGNPDFIFPREMLALFVDGCFWHGCPKHGTQPESNSVFWKKKLTRNKIRDRLVNRTLQKNGWTVLRIWQHELKRKNQIRLLGQVRRSMTGF